MEEDAGRLIVVRRWAPPGGVSGRAWLANLWPNGLKQLVTTLSGDLEARMNKNCHREYRCLDSENYDDIETKFSLING